MAQKEKQKKSSYFEVTVVNYKTFTGYTCGSWYCHKGAASNYLWLPETPQWGIRSPNNFQAFVYGAKCENIFYGMKGMLIIRMIHAVYVNQKPEPIP